MRRYFRRIIWVTVVLLASICIGPVHTAVAATPQESSCNVLAKIDDLSREMASLSLQVSTKDYEYTEVRAGKTQTFKDPEKQIALGLLNLETCTTNTVVITKHGNQLIAPGGYDIEAVLRVNGIQWNNWATEYRIIKPAGWFVIGNEYPYVKDESTTHRRVAASGKIIRTTTTTRTITNVFYTPYSEELVSPALITAGQEYTREISTRVDAGLRAAKVMSRAYPGTLVVDVPYLKPEYPERRLAMEHMDQSEFNLDPQYTTGRVFTVIGANRDRFATYTCSPAKACGPRQFIPETWKLIVQAYPAAKLNPNFTEGARDPVSAGIAGRLLDDYNLNVFKQKLSTKEYAALIADSRLTEETLDSAYNTGAGRTTQVLKAYFTHREGDWTEVKGKGSKGHLLTQTKGYIAKLRYMYDEWPGSKEVVVTR